MRCAWAGSQKYAVLTWSGDIYSSFRSMREQLQAGLNMGMAGIPWWTSDIGGFLGGDISDPSFQELLVRWFEWGAFCPVFRMHGERSPWYEREQEFIDGVRQLTSGQDNEAWSFGEENYKILSCAGDGGGSQNQIALSSRRDVLEGCLYGENIRRRTDRSGGSAVGCHSCDDAGRMQL